MRTTSSGTVVGFGEDGWGTVRSEDGQVYPFHSTALVDGTRRIAVGTTVSFTVVPGHSGRWEASTLTS